MTQTRKTTFFLKIALCITLALSMFGAVLGFATSNNLTAKAETVEYQDLLGIENRDWGAGEDFYYFGGVTLDPFGWFNSADSVNGCWHNDNKSIIEANGGVDILEYIYINNKSARQAIKDNNGALLGTSGWLTNPAASPVYVETTNGSGIIIQILKAYAGENYTITFKAGFELTRNDGVRIHVSDDIIYDCVGNVCTKRQKSTITFNDENGNPYTTKRVVTGSAIGTLPEVPAKSGYVGFWKMDGVALDENTIISTNKTATPVYGVEYEEYLGLEDRSSWASGENAEVISFGVMDFSITQGNQYFSSFTPTGQNAACWYRGNTTAIAQNSGLDIMQYIYINGQSARDALNANTENKQGSYGWLTNPAAWPIAVQTEGDFWIRLDSNYFGTSFTFTFKKGFSILKSDGTRVYLSSDISYNYENGTLGERTVAKTYTLTFDGSTTKELQNGDKIGELPEVPANGDYTGAWTIDGVKITADTVYNYGADKTATAVYTKDVTDTVKIEFSSHNSVQSNFKIFINPANALCTNGAWNIQGWDTTLISNNNGVDIMNYIYINDQNIRELSNDNRTNNTYPVGDATGWFTNSDQCRPVFVETNSEGIWVTVLHSFSTENYKVTLKAGFSIVDANGGITVINKDVKFQCTSGGEVSKLTGYTLTFEGSSSRQVEGGATIGELPEVPARDGYEGYWTIDGVAIDENTIYNYGADKTAVAVYTKDVTDTVRIEFAGHTSVQSNFKIFINPANALCENGAWNIQGWDTTLISNNNGVDIMNYIYINDQNIRELSDNNRIHNTYPLGDGTGWLGNSDQCRPAFVETNGEGIWVTVLHSFSSEEYKVTLKAGFAILDANGGTSVISEDVEFICTTGGGVIKVEDYTLSFEGLAETVPVVSGQEIGQLPKVPAKDGCEGFWTIDGAEITEKTIYNYDTDKTAVASYRVDISNYLALEDRAWGADAGEYYFGVLDTRDGNVTKNGKGEDVKYLNTQVADTWYAGNTAPITANNGLDIMQYIYINDDPARDLITANYGDGNPNKTNSCGCWLSNPAAWPVYVDTTVNSAIIIKVAQAYVGNYFEITFKSGFTMVNDQGDTVYLSKDVTFKYIVNGDNVTLAKGKITDEELDVLDGKAVTLMNGNETYLSKTTKRLTLPNIDPVIVEEGLSQVLVGWTTDINNLSSSNLYPVGYKLDIEAETTLHAVWLGFELQDGAAVKLTAGTGGSGIRFLTDIDKGGYQVGVNSGLIIGRGTFLVPTDYLDTGAEPTHATFAAWDGTGENGTNPYYMDVAAEKWRVNGEENSTWTFAAAFIGISANQYSRSFSARGYLKIQFATGVGYVYTPYEEEKNARSIYEVATSAYKDIRYPQFATDTTINTYVDNVADLTWSNYEFLRNDEAVGDYEVTDISVSGNVVTVKLNGNVTSAVVNGKRLANGSTSRIKIGEFVFSVSGFTTIDGGFQFTLGAANRAEKESEESLYFTSSNADLDFFLNDFFKRHTGVWENGENQKVNSTIAGVDAEEFFNQEWVSMSYYWFNSFEGYVDENGYNQDRLAGMNRRLAEIPIDDYGYVWSSNDRVRDPKSTIDAGEQKMGWPFPNSESVGIKHWEFNSGKESWTDNISASASGGLYGKTLSNQSSNITFTSNSFSSWSSNKICTFYAPLLEFEVRIDDATNIEDIYVWYTTSSATSFSEDKRVSVKDKAFLNYDLGSCTGEYNHILYLPMYAETAWGESTSIYVKQLKIEIALKSGKTLSGYVGLNYVRPTLDTRMSNNNSIYISSLRTAYDYTGDLDFLSEQMVKARKAYNFLMQMYDSTRKLKKESYLVGHGGAKEGLTGSSLFGYSATNKSIASAISQGYWDIMYMPEYDFQSNLYFQKALADMAYLEQVMIDNDLTPNNDTKALSNVKTAKRGGGYSTSQYRQYYTNIAKMNTTASNNLGAIQANLADGGFWNPETGRFAAGYDPNGTLYDYGYVAWNLEAIYYGVATDDQASSIMTWLASEGSLYDYVFAPRSITVSGTDVLNGEYAAKKGEWDFGDNCQYGGAILYTSFYDIMSRIKVNGKDDAFARLTAIQEWYKEIYDYYVANDGSDPYDFYRYYYDNKGIQCQGMGTAGAVGLDREFLESVLPMASVAYGFFGIDSVDGKTLQVAPELPDDLDYWKMENLAFNKVKYDLTIYDNAIQLNNVRGGDVSGLSLTVALNYTNGQTVYVNGVAVTPDKIADGKAYVTVDFGATIVEVK